LQQFLPVDAGFVASHIDLRAIQSNGTNRFGAFDAAQHQTWQIESDSHAARPRQCAGRKARVASNDEIAHRDAAQPIGFYRADFDFGSQLFFKFGNELAARDALNFAAQVQFLTEIPASAHQKQPADDKCC
jgi:hypothetical protein